jgi:hypothetical protein
MKKWPMEQEVNHTECVQTVGMSYAYISERNQSMEDNLSLGNWITFNEMNNFPIQWEIA